MLIPYVVSTIQVQKVIQLRALKYYGYGAGYKHMKMYGDQLLNRLQEIVDDGINVVFVVMLLFENSISLMRWGLR